MTDDYDPEQYTYEVNGRLINECAECAHFMGTVAKGEDDSGVTKVFYVQGRCDYDWVVPPCFLTKT